MQGQPFEPRQAWLLGHLCLSGTALNITGAIDVIGDVAGRDVVAEWTEEVYSGGWGEPGARGCLPEFFQKELRKVIHCSLGKFLDNSCLIRLARLGYVRVLDWSSEELEHELADDVPFSGGLLDRISGWFISGLTQQATQLYEGLWLLTALYGLSFGTASPSLGMVLQELLRVGEVAHGCLKAAAPLAKKELIVCGGNIAHGFDRLAGLLAVRVLDWAFRRVEMERSMLTLRQDWRMLTCQFFWTFITDEKGTLVGTPAEVIRAFTVQKVLPACQIMQLSGVEQTSSHVHADSVKTVDVELASYGVCAGDSTGAEFLTSAQSGPEESEAGLAKREAQRRRRARNKERKGASCQFAEDDLEDEALTNAALQENEAVLGERESALHEWNRLSVQLMMKMGWRAEEEPRRSE